ncbi:MAG: hypothetical protein AB2697_19775 [Candidatus Thiodiazotropha endolucinida]
MKNEPLEAEIEAFRARFMAHVPKDSPDDSLVILKGHLLSEEILGDFISTKVAHPDHLHLEDGRWGFAKKVELAASMSNKDNHDKWVWSALKKLNSLRNKYSHSLEPKGLDIAISEFRFFVSPHSPRRYLKGELTLYGCVLLTVTGLFVVAKSEDGEIT